VHDGVRGQDCNRSIEVAGVEGFTKAAHGSLIAFGGH
jgi:hypothetical protein